MEAPSEDWQWDDKDLIGPEDVLYRRVPRDPRYFKTEDRFRNGAICLMPIAFNLADADIDPDPEEVSALQALDPPPQDVDDIRARLKWGKSRAIRAFRAWTEIQESGQQQDQAGCSIYIESLMRRNGIPTSALVDWSASGVGRFTAADVRKSGGGVVGREDQSDADLGKAHGLVRTQSPGMRSGPAWSGLRNKLLDHVQYFDADPGYAAG
ncbi:hypothetical protein SAMN04488581_4451 [Mycolicibacterium neoaurum]|uniref:hypothetical protein n=1 Tax=Mycolicibacterium neoaurum TaxID=1795 RepID=UPI00056A5A0E|nr:hypothetical protein [Mycolicibacterium neoaurum]SDE65056.1 hypothetical protein SAMN04488581_4451 [Mycolicibacterium neoaurum]